MIDSTILHYHIIKEIGRGGMGVVYLAEDTKLKREVAIKFLPEYITADQEQKKRFELEAQAAASLNHPNITTIHAIEKSDNDVFIVMEYIDGIELKDKIKTSPVSVEETLNIAIQVAEGLEAAHSKGIIHRDIKSPNIMITGDGKVKIMDFGLAKLKGGEKLTKIGTTVGTTAYMSPEQARGEEVDYKTDIWSFGVVIYEMVTGELPFRGDYDQAVIFSIMNNEPVSLPPSLPEEGTFFINIISKALSKNKDERYQKIDDLLTDLRREGKNLEYKHAGYIKSSAAGPVSYEDKSGTKTQKNRRIIQFIIPAIVVLILISAFIFLNPFKFSITEEQSSDIQKNSLAVMYFENIPDPEDKDHNSEMLTNLLITSLTQVKGLEVISRERLLDIQKDLVQNGKTISASFASQVAMRAGVNTMLIGSILKEKPTLAVTTRLIDVSSGNIISSQQVISYKADKIFSLVDTLALLIRKNLHVTSSGPAKIKSVADVTTKSSEAYRAYAAGLELFEKRYVKEAGAAFSRAIELDKNFAMAYYHLSKVQSFTGVTDASQKSLKKAVELSDRTTERERLQILTYNYVQQKNFPKAIEGYNQLIKKFPLDINSYVQLGANVYDQVLLEPEKGLEILQQGLLIEPDSKTLRNLLAYTYAWLNKKQEGIKTVNKYISLAPAEPNPYDTKGDLYAWFRDYDSSRAAYRKAISLRSDFITNASLGSYSVLDKDYDNARNYFNACSFGLPWVEAHRGQIKNAEKKLSKLPEFQITESNKLRTLVNYSYESGQYTEMLKLARQLSTELKKDPTDIIYGRDYLAWALIKNGKSSEADNVLYDLENDVNGISAFSQVISDYTYALISLEEGRNESALERFRKVIKMLPPNHEPFIFYSIALLRTGQISEAIAELQKLKYWPNSGDLYIVRGLPGSNLDWPIPAVKAYYWLGVAYEKQGNREKAIVEFKKFLEIWNDADFTSAELKDARIQIQKLEGMAAK